MENRFLKDETPRAAQVRQSVTAGSHAQAFMLAVSQRGAGRECLDETMRTPPHDAAQEDNCMDTVPQGVKNERARSDAQGAAPLPQ